MRCQEISDLLPPQLLRKLHVKLVKDFWGQNCATFALHVEWESRVFFGGAEFVTDLVELQCNPLLKIVQTIPYCIYCFTTVSDQLFKGCGFDSELEIYQTSKGVCVFGTVNIR